MAALVGARLFLPNFVRAAVLDATTVQANFTLCEEQLQPNCVIDGDTIHVDDVRIQISDIDAPETYRADCARQRMLGERTARRLQQLLNSGPFQLVRAGWRDEDRYGRKLRVLERDGNSLGDVLVGEGLARPWGGAREDWCR